MSQSPGEAGVASGIPQAGSSSGDASTGEAELSAADFGIFDNFNRTTAGPIWTTASSGAPWQSFTPSNCTGYTAAIDGTSGVMTGSTGATCSGHWASDQLSNPADPNLRPWDAPSWALTAKFKTSALDGSRWQISVATQVNQFNIAGATMDFNAGTGQVEIDRGIADGVTASFSWQANTWYSMKLVVIWGDQTRLKVWPASGAEPSTWLLATLANSMQNSSPLLSYWYSPFGATSVFVDDIAFGPAPILPKLPPPPGTEDNPPYINGDEAGDPVGTANGTFSDTHVDVAIPGRGPAISFARSYNSNDTRATTLGPGWTHSYNIRLTDPDDGTSDIILIGPQGRSDRYVSSGGSFTAPKGVHRTLVKNADDTYTATDKGQTAWLFDYAGLLTQIRDRYGNASNLTYANGRLATVSDPAGRGVLTFNYVGDRLSSVTDWASPARTRWYFYDSNGRLWKAQDRNARTTIFTYDGTSQRIATITDARGIVTLTNTYDAQGRVATQKDGRGFITGEVTTFDYVTNPDATTTTTLTVPATSFEPAFHPTLADTYDTNGWLIGRVTRPSSTDTLTQSFTYDTAGNQTSATDPRGARSDFCYDVDYAGVTVAGAAANLTRTIGPAASPGQPRPVTLVKYDATNNLIQTVSPRGVPSTSTSTCATDLSGINTMFAVDYTYDATAVRLLATARRFTDPDTGQQKTATTKYEYGDAANQGLITRIIPPRGNTTGSPDYTYAQTLSYSTTGSSAGMLKDVTDPLGNKTSFTTDAVGRVVSLVDPLGNAAGGVPADHTTAFTYDNEDRLLTTSQPSPTAGGTALVTQTFYDPVGNPNFRMDANGQVTGMTYDERNSLSTVSESAAPWTSPFVANPSPITTEYLYDAGGNATRITRVKGDAANERATDYTFDGRGLRRSETQYPAWPSTAGPLVTAITYDSNGNQLTRLDPLGQTTTYGYDAWNQLTSIDYSSPGTPDAGFTYDLDGNRTGMTDGTGASSYAFDESGQLLSATTPGPKVVGYRYDLDGHRTTLIYPDTTAVTYAFDKAGQLGSLTDWASRAVAYTYWPDGLVKTAALPDGASATYTYDNARRLVDVLHQRLTTTITHEGYTLDRIGNVTAVVDYVAGLTPVPVWSSAATVNDVVTADQTRPSLAVGADDAVHAVWADTRSGDSDIWYARRDPISGVWSASVQVNNYITGAQTQPVICVDAAGTVYVLWTDARLGATDDDIYFSKRAAAPGSLWSVSTRVNSDGAGKRQYDPAIAISSSGVVMAAWYDERGGGSKKYIYSARLPAGSSTWSTNYQVSSNSSAVKGDPDLTIGSDGTTYAAWRDLQSGNADVWFATLPNNGTTWSANTKISDDPGTALQDAPDIGIDAAGNVLVVWNDARTSPSQIRVRKRPAGTTIWSASTVLGGSTTNAPALAVRSDGLAYASWSNGTLGTLTTLWGAKYDPTAGTWSSQEQITLATEESAAASVAFTTGRFNVAYQRRPTAGTYDIHMRRKPITGEESVFGYDSLDRLTSVAGPDGARSYSYDPVGNRISRVAGPTTSYTYDRADRMTDAGGVAVTTDANGNLVARGSDAYAYDQANRLSSATIGGATETYVYDGTGTRFSRQLEAGTPTRYVSDVGGGLPTVIDDGSRKYVYGLGLAYAANGSAIEVYHADRLDSTRAITNSSGTVTVGYRTDEWGLPKASTGSSSQPFGYTGEPGDATGLTYLRARYYNPDLGRFMSRDEWFGSPVMSQSLNRYAYVVNNPMTRNDPSGHCGIDAAADVAFIVYDVASLAFGPPKDRFGNLLAFGADTVGLIIPCATGLGLAVRGSVKVAEHADEVPKAIKWVDEAVRAACSFTPETLVATPDGLVEISSIEIGDIVLAWDESSGQIVERAVTAVLRHPDNEIARITIDGFVVTTTPDHPFFTVEKGWVEAGLLWSGAHVVSASGSGSVSQVESDPYDGILWNLTVDQSHTFFVGRGESLVHNSCRIKLPTLDATGKVHGPLPGFPPKGWTRDQMEELAGDLRSSILRRKDELMLLGEDGPHRARIGQEEQLLRQLEKLLSGS